MELNLKNEEIEEREKRIDNLESQIEELAVHLKAANIDMADTNSSISPGLR